MYAFCSHCVFGGEVVIEQRLGVCVIKGSPGSCSVIIVGVQSINFCRLALGSGMSPVGYKRMLGSVSKEYLVISKLVSVQLVLIRVDLISNT